jgi:hypothetical protein
MLCCHCCWGPPMHAQVVCSFVIILLTTSSLLGPADRCYLSSKPSELGPCYFAVTAGAVSISTAVLAGCLKVRSSMARCMGYSMAESIHRNRVVQPIYSAAGMHSLHICVLPSLLLVPAEENACVCCALLVLLHT